ncbi:hypothetical protein AGDE_08073 [Angomonas deanei]|nr:hypothetical protein AGDE_08073 [Angomonas deanei]|eukprot:EPY34019.1 hypothetical protein AGDE_08073 [Angomonas deanei]
MAGEDVQHYQTALTAKPKERGLLGYALGGPCMTMYVAGVHNDNPTTAEPLLAVCDAMTSIKCSGLRHGSVRRFLRHTTPTFQILEEKSKSVPPGGKNNYAIQAARVATMVKDGQALLDAPAGQVPQVYQK